MGRTYYELWSTDEHMVSPSSAIIDWLCPFPRGLSHAVVVGRRKWPFTRVERENPRGPSLGKFGNGIQWWRKHWNSVFVWPKLLLFTGMVFTPSTNKWYMLRKGRGDKQVTICQRKWNFYITLLNYKNTSNILRRRVTTVRRSCVHFTSCIILVMNVVRPHKVIVRLFVRGTN